MEQRQGEYEYQGRSDEVYVLLMLGVAELIECTNQGVLVVQLDGNVEVDCGGRTVPKLAKGNADRI